MPRRGTLTTARLDLEPWSERHIGLVIRLASLPEVTRYVGDGRPWPRERAEQLVERIEGHWLEHGFGWRVAIERDTRRQVGVIALSFAGEGAGVPADEHEIGWWLDPADWGRGLAREGAAAVRDEAFASLGAPSLVARVQPANLASLAVARAAGLIDESAGVGRAGEPFVLLRLRRRRWRALRDA